MKLGFVPPTLQGLDRVQADALVLGVFEQDRPLRGLAGLADWRLNGQVSRVLETGRFTAGFGDLILLPSGHRMGPERCLLFGLGEVNGFSEGRLADVAEWVFTTVSKMSAMSLTMSFPGAHRSAVPTGRAARLLVAAAGRAYAQRGDALRLKLMVRSEDRREIQSSLEGRSTGVPVDFLEGSF